MRFSTRAVDATIFQKIASPSQAKNRSCSRGLKSNGKLTVTLNNRVQVCKWMSVNLHNRGKWGGSRGGGEMRKYPFFPTFSLTLPPSPFLPARQAIGASEKEPQVSLH